MIRSYSHISIWTDRAQNLQILITANNVKRYYTRKKIQSNKGKYTYRQK